MDNSVEVLAGMAAVAVAALAAFSAYRWQQRRRARAVSRWVTDYLVRRFGGPLDELSIDCTDDRLWPVLASCDDPRTRVRHRLQFSCTGPDSAWSLLSEQQERR